MFRGGGRVDRPRPGEETGTQRLEVRVGNPLTLRPVQWFDVPRHLRLSVHTVLSARAAWLRQFDKECERVTWPCKGQEICPWIEDRQLGLLTRHNENAHLIFFPKESNVEIVLRDALPKGLRRNAHDDNHDRAVKACTHIDERRVYQPFHGGKRNPFPSRPFSVSPQKTTSERPSGPKFSSRSLICWQVSALWF